MHLHDIEQDSSILGPLKQGKEWIGVNILNKNREPRVDSAWGARGIEMLQQSSKPCACMCACHNYYEPINIGMC